MRVRLESAWIVCACAVSFARAFNLLTEDNMAGSSQETNLKEALLIVDILKAEYARQSERKRMQGNYLPASPPQTNSNSSDTVELDTDSPSSFEPEKHVSAETSTSVPSSLSVEKTPSIDAFHAQPSLDEFPVPLRRANSIKKNISSSVHVLASTIMTKTTTKNKIEYLVASILEKEKNDEPKKQISINNKSTMKDTSKKQKIIDNNKSGKSSTNKNSLKHTLTLITARHTLIPRGYLMRSTKIEPPYPVNHPFCFTNPNNPFCRPPI